MRGRVQPAAIKKRIIAVSKRWWEEVHIIRIGDYVYVEKMVSSSLYHDFDIIGMCRQRQRKFTE